LIFLFSLSVGILYCLLISGIDKLIFNIRVYIIFLLSSLIRWINTLIFCPISLHIREYSIDVTLVWEGLKAWLYGGLNYTLHLLDDTVLNLHNSEFMGGRYRFWVVFWPRVRVMSVHRYDDTNTWMVEILANRNLSC